MEALSTADLKKKQWETVFVYSFYLSTDKRYCMLKVVKRVVLIYRSCQITLQIFFFHVQLIMAAIKPRIAEKLNSLPHIVKEFHT